MDLTVSTERRDGGILYLIVTGEVDLSTAGVLQREIVSGLDAQDVPGIVVDLTEVTFLDSSGIRVLLKGRRSAEEKAKSYLVDAPRGGAGRILDISGVREHLAYQGTGER
nr:STAS domain-containing protein [Planosporangium thailandense]